MNSNKGDEEMSFIMTYDERNRGNLNKLGDHTRKAAEQWYQYCIDNQIDLLIYETIRTKEQQQQYVNTGKSQTMKSYHLVGQALDFVPVEGKVAKWDGYETQGITKAINKAKELGFEWGGEWRSFVDKPHLQYNYKGYGTDTLTETTTKPPSTSGGNEAIKGIQTTLNKRYGTGLVADGYYGPKTKQALTKGLQVELNNQYNRKLIVDGAFGVKTKAACIVVAKGVKGNITYLIQGALYCQGCNPNGIDGIFGTGTEKAVRTFQQKKGIAVDGKVGGNTFEKLLK